MWMALQIRANSGICSIETANTTYGFFAQMNCCLWIFEYCERRRVVPNIRLTNDTYRDPNRGPNWLEHYFNTIYTISADQANRVRYNKKSSNWTGHTE